MNLKRPPNRIAPLVFAALLAATFHLVAQQPSQATTPATGAAAPLPAYDVIAIHQNKSGSYAVSLRIKDATLVATNIDLGNLVSNAYNIRPALISGFPDWANSARFDINAKVTDLDINRLEKLSEDQRRSMLLTLLTARFHLRAHLQPRILPVYDLVVTKGGPKFKEHPAAPPQSGDERSDSKPGVKFGNSEMTAISMPISNLVWNLSYRVGREVIDKTGLTGKYDFSLKWRSDEEERAGIDSYAPDIFTALQEQLGLKLVPSKGSVDTLVVDHIEMPSEN